jgi:hypothetical protein
MFVICGLLDISFYLQQVDVLTYYILKLHHSSSY